MKNNLFIYILALLVISVGCSDDELGPQVELGDSFTISSPTDGSAIVLSQDDDLSSTAVTFEYEAADFGYSAAVNYQLQLDNASGDFSNPIVVTTSVSTSLPVAVGQLNNAVLGLGAPSGSPASLKARLVARIHPTIDTLVSNEVAIDVTPFEIAFPFLHVPGAYQGWNPADSSTIIYSTSRDGRYDGYIYFQEISEYKFTDGPSWDLNYGDTGADGSLEQNGDNLSTMAAGMHRLTVDINTLTHTRELTNWGLIGSATPTGWDSDTDFIYDSDSGTLKLTVDLIEGEIKFRANDDWALNYGDTGANGSLEEAGDNILITEAGNYTVELILNTPVFTYNVTKN